MKKYFTWVTLPGAIVAGLLESWLGGFGIVLTFILFFIGLALWIKFSDCDLP